jgi:hypothetical protein
MQQCRTVSGKSIYIVRNPRDVMLSIARYIGIVPSQADSARGWAKKFIENRGDPNWPDVTGTWPQNVQEWASPARVRKYFPGTEVLTLRYEDLRADSVTKLHEILEFLEFPHIDPARVRNVAESSSIEHMRALEETKLASRRSMARRPVDVHQRRFVGQGMHNQSLTAFGADIEDAYQRLTTEDEEFAHCVRQFGYLPRSQS